MSGDLARGPLQIRCAKCGRHYRRHSRAWRALPRPCTHEGCDGTVRRETVAEQEARLAKRKQLLTDAREAFAIERLTGKPARIEGFTNPPWEAKDG